MAKTIKAASEVHLRRTYAIINIHLNDEEYNSYVNQYGCFNETVYTSVDDEGEYVLPYADVPNTLRVVAKEQYNKIVAERI